MIFAVESAELKSFVFSSSSFSSLYRFTLLKDKLFISMHFCCEISFYWNYHLIVVCFQRIDTDNTWLENAVFTISDSWMKLYAAKWTMKRSSRIVILLLCFHFDFSNTTNSIWFYFALFCFDVMWCDVTSTISVSGSKSSDVCNILYLWSSLFISEWSTPIINWFEPI